MTSGNGVQHAIIIGNGRGLNLEDLADTGQMKYRSSDLLTRLRLTGITISWILLLITAAGKIVNTWYLLVVGGICILYNVLVAGRGRDRSAFSVHLEFQEAVGKMTAMDTLLALENNYTHAGRSLLPIFFPEKSLPEEIKQWSELEVKAAQEKERA